MVYTIYHLSVGICANEYSFSHIPNNKLYSPHYRTLQYCKVRWCIHCIIYQLVYMLMDIHSYIYLLINDIAHTIALYSTVKCNGVTIIIISRYIWECALKKKYLLINYTWSHRCTLQYWCGLYNLLVGICENGYPLAHIPTDKWFSVYTIALYSTVKCDGVCCIIY